MSSIRVADPGREYEVLAAEVDAALLRVGRSGRYVQGAEHDAFEAEFAGYLGVRHGVAVGNGSDALELALKAVGCGPGDEVVTVANAGGFAAHAAAATGAAPVFVDVEPETLLLDPSRLDAAIGARTRAVVVTHLFGQLHADIEQIIGICARHGVASIEDCAQATGARSGGRHAGSFGTMAAHSFYPTKNLGGLGDGGMVTTDDPELRDRLVALRQYGRTHPHHATLRGGRNSRLDEIQAAVLRVKLGHLEGFVERRRAVATAYRSAAPGRWWAGEGSESFSAHLAVTRDSDRDRLRAAAESVGVCTAVHFPTPDHLQPSLAVPGQDLPETERACREVISLPCHPHLTDDEVGSVVRFLERWNES